MKGISLGLSGPPFGQRRKTLLNALSGAGLAVPREAWQQILEQARIDPGRRGETPEPPGICSAHRVLSGLQGFWRQIKRPGRALEK